MRREDRRTLLLLEDLAAVSPATTAARRMRVTSMLRVLLGPGRATWVAPEPVGRLLVDELAELMDVHASLGPAGGGQVAVRMDQGGLAATLRLSGLLDRRGRLLVGLPSHLVSATGASALAALSGLVLAGGVVGRSNWSLYLQLHAPTLEAAMAYARLARHIGVNLRIKETPSVVATVREGDMAVLLAALGASAAQRALEAELEATRLSPHEAQGLETLSDANLDRSLQAARRVCAEVEEALAVLGADTPEHLASAGNLRLAHPELSLEALGRQADPPLSKDAIAGRLRRLLALARQRAAS